MLCQFITSALMINSYSIRIFFSVVLSSLFPPFRHVNCGLQAHGDRQPPLRYRGPAVRRLAHLQTRHLRQQVHQDPGHRHPEDTQAE